MPMSAVLPRRSTLHAAAIWCLFVALASLGQAAAQTPAQAQPLELDLQRLLNQADQPGFQDTVWRLTPSPGRKIMLLPLAVRPGDADAELTRSPIGPKGGRFIGFAIPAPQADPNTTRYSINYDLFCDDSEGALTRLLFGSTSDPSDPNAPDTEAHNPSDTDQPQGATYASPPPRLARRIVIHPDGMVQWGLDRGFPSAELETASEQNLYAYELDPEQLREKEPPKPERITRQDGESSRDYAERRRVQQLEQRDQMEAYRELRDSLRDLPEDFKEPAKLVYAVFEVREDEGLDLQGEAPMPWSLDAARMQLLQQIAQPGGGELTDEKRNALSQLGTVLDQNHPLDARVIALSALEGGIAASAQLNDPGYQLLAKLVASQDPIARRIALYAVARAEPQTRACAGLLERAAQSAKDDERVALQLASLKTLLSLDANDPERAGELVAAVNKTLADPKGPPAALVLEQLLAALDPQTLAANTEGATTTAQAMIAGVDFAAVPADQLDAVIAVVVRHAPTSPIAAGWLDHKLLRAEAAETVNRTLARLSKVEIASPADQTDADPDAPQAPPAPPAPVNPDTLANAIPLTAFDHGLVLALGSEDEGRRTLAWDALRNFRVSASSSQDPSADPQAQMQLTFEAILKKGMDQQPTPPALVGFIDNHNGPALGTPAIKAMLRLLIDAKIDPEVAKLAAQRIAASPDYGPVLTSLIPEEQLLVVNALYQRLETDTPPIVGLIADPASGMIGWFAQQLDSEDARGTLPTASAWSAYTASQALGEQQLIQIVASSPSPDASAAAVKALVINAGGNAQEQERFAQTVGTLDPRDAATIAEAWTTIKARLFSDALLNAQGAYTLAVVIHPGDNGDPLLGPPATPTRIDLAQVQLHAKGTTVSLAGSTVRVAEEPGERLAIRLASLSDLGTFKQPGLANLPLSQLDQPLDLLPTDTGAWLGKFNLPDGRSLDIRLDPVK